MRRICGEIYGHSSTLYARRLDIFERTAALGVPAIYQSPEFAEEGGLSGYGPRITQMFRQLARQLAKVLGGEKVSDVPVEQPTTFELAINLQAATTHSMSVRQATSIATTLALLALADNNVIEQCFRTRALSTPQPGTEVCEDAS